MSESLTTRVLRRPDVQRRTGLGRTAIYVLMAEGKFPAPIRLTAKAVGWLRWTRAICASASRQRSRR